jgi:arylsulfatase A-like enzyme
MIGRFSKRRKKILFSRQVIISLLCITLLLFLFLVLKREDYQRSRNENKKSPKSKPNIVLVTMDTVRADHLSCYGYQRITTPNLDRLSQEGVLFKNAYATNSWTLPSHASIFTGMFPTKHGADHSSTPAQDIRTQKGEILRWKEMIAKSFSKLSDDNHTLAEILSEKGYRTAGIIGGIFCNSIFGLDQGFDYYDDEIPYLNTKFFVVYHVVDHVFSLDDFFTQYGYLGKRIAADLNNSAFKWLEKNHEHPFFLFINYMDAHAPYLPPPPYDRYFGKDSKDIIVSRYAKGDSSFLTAEKNLINSVLAGSHQLTPEEREHIIVLYDGGIRYLDHYLGLLFAKLKALEIYDNTLIIISSDHGETFGEHHQMEHGRTLYEEVLRVPLIIRHPSAYLQRGVVEKRVSLVDLMPTILSFLRYPIPSGIDGENMEKSNHLLIAELFLGMSKKNHKGTSDLRALYEGKEKYIWASNGSNQLYNLEKDPQEEENLIEKFPSKAEAMQKSLDRWLSSFKPLKAEGKKVAITKSTEEKLRALGYVR